MSVFVLCLFDFSVCLLFCDGEGSCFCLLLTTSTPVQRGFLVCLQPHLPTHPR